MTGRSLAVAAAAEETHHDRPAAKRGELDRGTTMRGRQDEVGCGLSDGRGRRRRRSFEPESKGGGGQAKRTQISFRDGPERLLPSWGPMPHHRAASAAPVLPGQPCDDPPTRVFDAERRRRKRAVIDPNLAQGLLTGSLEPQVECDLGA